MTLNPKGCSTLVNPKSMQHLFFECEYSIGMIYKVMEVTGGIISAANIMSFVTHSSSIWGLVDLERVEPLEEGNTKNWVDKSL